MLSNKNPKYLLYKFSDQIESMKTGKILVRHTSKVKDEVGLHKIDENDSFWQKKHKTLKKQFRTK